MAVKHVLVLGGGGFIGEYAVRALRARGCVVSAPSHQELDLKHVDLLGHAVAEHDTIVVLTTPDLPGIKALVATLATAQPKQVIYASTTLLYGSSEEPQTENVPLRPTTPYEQQKFAEEQLLHTLQGHNLTILRLGNVYGGVKNRGLVGLGLRAMHGGEPLRVSGEQQRRDFIHVEDVAEAVAHVVVSSLRGVINVTTGVGTSISEILTLLERAAGKGIPWVRVEAGEFKSVIGNNDKLAASGFTPTIAVEDGLKRTVQDYARSIR
jgi:UDP-glucose 4-epimerase